jgi:hypothetical protein
MSRAVVSNQFGGGVTPALLRAERRGPGASATGAGSDAAGGAGAAGMGSVLLRCAGHCAKHVGRPSAEGGLKAGHSSSSVRGGVLGVRGSGLPCLRTARCSSSSRSQTGAQPAQMGEGLLLPLNLSSREPPLHLVSAWRRQATRHKPGNSSLFHMTSRETMMPPRLLLADGSQSFQPLKSSGQPRKTHV